jgi:hypothetical protein
VHFEKKGGWERIPWRRALGLREAGGGDRRWGPTWERESFGREERKERKKEGASGPTGIERRVLVLSVP